MIKVPWWKKIALYLLTHGEQNHLELQSWREEKVGINPAPHRTESDFNFNLQIPVNCCHFQSDVCSFLLCYVLISLALTRGLRPEKLQLNVCFHFLFVIKDIFNHLLAHKIKTIKYLIRRWGQNHRILAQFKEIMQREVDYCWGEGQDWNCSRSDWNRPSDSREYQNRQNNAGNRKFNI